jgi:electron transfer flavoprotein alpha subunit
VKSGILVSSETDEGAFELLTKAREISKQLDLELSAVILGDRDDGIVQSYFEYGAQKTLLIPSSNLGTLDAETYANVLHEIAKENGPDVLLIRSTRLGKETAGRVAQKLQAGCITDAIGLTLKGQDLVVDRYALGGNTVSSEIIKSKKKVVSIMPRAFEAQKSAAQGLAQKMDLKIPSQRVQLVERRKKIGESANIESAETLICVGKGVLNKEDLGMMKELSSLMRGELGCTRALSSDYHWISEDRMVGISGKRCKPKLNVSIGVSGQIQHTVGIMGSKLIVAINKDREAPIFKIADYGVVGDLYQVVPKLIQRIKSLEA